MGGLMRPGTWDLSGCVSLRRTAQRWHSRASGIDEASRYRQVTRWRSIGCRFQDGST